MEPSVTLHGNIEADGDIQLSVCDGIAGDVCRLGAYDGRAASEGVVAAASTATRRKHQRADAVICTASIAMSDEEPDPVVPSTRATLSAVGVTETDACDHAAPELVCCSPLTDHSVCHVPSPPITDVWMASEPVLEPYI